MTATHAMTTNESPIEAPPPARRPRRWPWVAGVALLLFAGAWSGMSKRFPGEHPETAAYTARASGLALGAGFTSYASIDAALEKLTSRKLQPVRRTLASPADPLYPTHTLDTLTVSGYALLGTEGKVTLEFFNDRLYEVGFEPEDPEACSKALERSGAQLRRDHNGRAERTVGNWRIATNVDLAASDVGRSLATKPYVLWQELRLVRQRDEWDRRFGSLPVRAQ